MGQSSPSLGHVSINVSTIGHGPMQAAPTAAAAIAAEAAAAAANLHWMILCTGNSRQQPTHGVVNVGPTSQLQLFALCNLLCLPLALACFVGL